MDLLALSAFLVKGGQLILFRDTESTLLQDVNKHFPQSLRVEFMKGGN
jgi:hypothetical protein